MLSNLSVLLVHLDVLMLILSIVVSLVHDHISYAVNLLSCLNICFIVIIIIIIIICIDIAKWTFACSRIRTLNRRSLGSPINLAIACWVNPLTQ